MFLLLLLSLSPPAAAQSPPCQNDQVYCENSGQCLDSQFVCDGISQCGLDCSSGVCIGWNDELTERCNNCSDPELFPCHNTNINTGIDRCITYDYVCDGGVTCGDYSDDWASNCNDCIGQDIRLFRCMSEGVDRCLDYDRYTCDGLFTCDSLEDEDPDLCNDCEGEDLFLCEDRSMCLGTQFLCDTIPSCLDASRTKQTVHTATPRWSPVLGCLTTSSQRLPCVMAGGTARISQTSWSSTAAAPARKTTSPAPTSASVFQESTSTCVMGLSIVWMAATRDQSTASVMID